MIKKLFWVVVLLFSVVLLVWCGDKNVEENKNNEDGKEISKNLENSDKESDKKEKKIFKKEYQMTVKSYVEKDGKEIQWGEFEIAKKWKDSYINFEKMSFDNGAEKMPFKPVVSLKKWNMFYMQLDFNWKKIRVKWGEIWDENMWFDQEIFDIQKLNSEVKNNKNIEKTSEKINWEELTCYVYKEQNSEKTKTCVNEDEEYIAYIESQDSWILTKFSVVKFDDDADSDLFKTPSEVKSMQELMWMMWGK